MLTWFIRLTILAASLLFGQANAEPVVLKLSFFTSDRSTIYQCQIKPFVDAVNDDGQTVVRIDTSFSHGPDAVLSQQVKLLSTGAADIVDIPLMATPDLFPDSTVLLLPGLFRTNSEANLVFMRLVDAGVLTGFDKYFVLGAYLSSGQNIHSRKPLDTLAALQGQTIRVSNQIEADTLKQFGARPVLLPINQAMDSLAQGKIDGVTAPPQMLFEFGFARIAANHYQLQLGSIPSALVMSRTTFLSLPPDAQKVIRRHAGTPLSEHASACLEGKGRTTLAQLKSETRRKLTFPSPGDQEKADAAFATVIEQWALQSPRHRDLLTLVKSEIARVRASR